MIIKGQSRSGPGALAAHLGNAEKNEKVFLVETRGTLATDLRGALVEMDAHAEGTRCQKPLYHAAISPEPPHLLTPEQRTEAIDALEDKLGLTGHARVVVIHEKLGREHIHIVWSRIDLETMKAISDGHNYRKHEEVARDLERRFGHERVQGAHVEREGVERPDRTPSRAELRQEERTGIRGKQVKAEVTAAFQASDSPEAFKSALEDRGYVLAQGDRRDFVVIDRAGGIHSLARRLDGVNAAQLREFMSPLDRDALPTADQAKEIAEELEEQLQKKLDARDDTNMAKAYGKGEDYVSQATAAQRDHSARQDKLDEEFQSRSEARADEESELLRRQAEATKAEQQSSQQSSKTDDKFRASASEMTDAKQERLSQMLDEVYDADISPELEDDPNRQQETPGGGRTRSH